ncbi:hypothetical protein [Rudaeicoccus suwonensis]|uniref:Uncharacterized protein n=1 Tax=Rudaeicoccus suwonensis TaxID=657409 RepID=A0A561E4C9_9MICO|nr:hypothetical protein [Rudaeicoccus suwonensis]TWE10441.1 hypothetical protein BKA23_2802 [Rudaeicoccus suwonensis]
MKWLLLQTWMWCLLAFLVGAAISLAVAYLVFPSERDAFADGPQEAGQR